MSLQVSRIDWNQAIEQKKNRAYYDAAVCEIEHGEVEKTDLEVYEINDESESKSVNHVTYSTTKDENESQGL